MQNDGGQRNAYVDEEGKTKGATVVKLDEYDLDENGVIGNRELVMADNVHHFIGPNSHTPGFSKAHSR